MLAEEKTFKHRGNVKTPEIVREFIDRIVIHERSERWKKKNYTQQVDVYFNFVGQV